MTQNWASTLWRLVHSTTYASTWPNLVHAQVDGTYEQHVMGVNKLVAGVLSRYFCLDRKLR